MERRDLRVGRVVKMVGWGVDGLVDQWIGEQQSVGRGAVGDPSPRHSPLGRGYGEVSSDSWRAGWVSTWVSMLWGARGWEFEISDSIFQRGKGIWNLNEDGRWQMADGRWQMADGRWQIEVGGRFCICV